MSPPSSLPPDHVRQAFGVREHEPELIAATPVWRCGEVTLKPVAGPAEAAWVATTLDTLQVTDLRLGRPLRSSDGRWVVGGWAATRFLSGRPEPRHDEVVAVSLRLHAATAGLAKPRHLEDRADVWAMADRIAHGEQDVSVVPAADRDMVRELLAMVRPVELAAQVVHGDLFGNVLFAGSAPPAIIDFTAYWRPREWAAAVVVVDALAWGGADPELLDRWSELAHWPQALLRALLFRVIAHSLHPRSTPESMAGMHRAISLVTRNL